MGEGAGWRAAGVGWIDGAFGFIFHYYQCIASDITANQLACFGRLLIMDGL
jgi:hypothetical protein